MSNFEKAVEFVLANEGGYVNNKRDKGGETKYGITKRDYPHLDIKNLTLAQARTVYLEDFWMPGPYDRIKNDAIATKLFDTEVNVGAGRAYRFLQTALNRMGVTVLVDGVIGSKTLAAMEPVNQSVLLDVYRSIQSEYYKGLVATNPNKAEFLRGWLIRASK